MGRFESFEDDVETSREKSDAPHTSPEAESAFEDLFKDDFEGSDSAEDSEGKTEEFDADAEMEKLFSDDYVETNEGEDTGADNGEKIGDFSKRQLQKIREEHPGWSDKLIEEIGTMENYKAVCKVLKEDAELLGLEEKYDDRQIALYKDDKGELYRVNNTMLPHKQYELNGYKNKTDRLGRIILAEGLLYVKERLGRLQMRDRIEAIGKGDERSADDRGHLIGDRFNGSNGMENMIPQDSQVNRNGFKNLENRLEGYVKEGREVYIRIQPKYRGDSYRPTSIIVTYTVDGKKFKQIFPNGGK